MMKLPARLLLAFFAVSLASLTPVLPGESGPTVQQRTCCPEMNMDAGLRCPINPGGTTTATCCTSPAACLLLYFGNANAFAAEAEMSGTISVNNDRITARFQRPPVPPPRAEFS
jgi:hypothetical protein